MCVIMQLLTIQGSSKASSRYRRPPDRSSWYLNHIVCILSSEKQQNSNAENKFIHTELCRGVTSDSTVNLNFGKRILLAYVEI